MGERGSKGGNGWGGRIGQQLGRLDRGAEEAARQAERRLEERRGMEGLLSSRPLLTLAAAFAVGIVLGLWPRR